MSFFCEKHLNWRFAEIQLSFLFQMDANGLVMMQPDIVEEEKVRRLEVWHHTRTVFEYRIHDCSNPITKLQKGQVRKLEIPNICMLASRT